MRKNKKQSKPNPKAILKELKRLNDLEYKDAVGEFTVAARETISCLKKYITQVKTKGERMSHMSYEDFAEVLSAYRRYQVTWEVNELLSLAEIESE